jgi:5'-phosphate synthase pdxT subunit
VQVRRPSELSGLDGLVIPGGESTVMARFLDAYGLVEPISGLAREGFPVWGLCAGAIILCGEVDGRPGSLGLLPARATRNAYGRQLSSFEEEIDSPVGPFPGIFIRAPRLEALEGAEVLGWRRSVPAAGQGSRGEAVMLRRGKIVAASFHPELSGNDGLHAWFLGLC